MLGAILALVLSASAAAAEPFPKIKRAHELSCSGAKAKLALTISWQKANRKGKHRGHAVALIRAKGGKIHHRKIKSDGLRRVRSQSIEYRFRFPKRASARLCKGKAKAEVVASHGHDKDRAGLVEIYRVARKMLGGKASASGEVGAAGQVAPDADCGGPTNSTIKAGAQLEECILDGADLNNADLAGANLAGASLVSASFQFASLVSANLNSAHLKDASGQAANLTGANLFVADLTGTELANAQLTGAFLAGATYSDTILFNADLTGADFTRSEFPFGATVTGANCSGATKPDGSKYPVGEVDNPTFPGAPFVQC